MRRVVVAFVSFSMLLLGCLGCESPTGPVVPLEAKNPSITYVATGGYFGEYHKLVIDSSGVASNQTVYPNLQVQLTGSERDSILALFAGFEKYQDSYPYFAFDSYHYKLTLRTSNNEKSVDIDESALQHNLDLSNLALVIERLATLELRIYQNMNTWDGLQFQFSFDKSTYVRGETIVALCRVSNTTPFKRTLYFRNQYHLQMGIFADSTGLPDVGWMPDYSIAYRDTSSPNQVTLAAGESVDVSQSWDQSYIHLGQSFNNLPVGKYSGAIFLLAAPGPQGAYPGRTSIRFQITD